MRISKANDMLMKLIFITYIKEEQINMTRSIKLNKNFNIKRMERYSVPNRTEVYNQQYNAVAKIIDYNLLLRSHIIIPTQSNTSVNGV